jgi:uncharacterized tellurite resistance protein B-like protein
MAGGPAPVELSADCTTCGLETGVVEVYDTLVAACRFGLPASARCRLCGTTHEGTFNRPAARPMHDVPANRCPACMEELGPRSLDDRRCAKCGAVATLALVAPAASLDSEHALLAALDAWTAREQWTSRAALLEATFCDPDLGSLLLRIRRNEPLEVMADPFSGAAPTALQRISVPPHAVIASDATATMTSAGIALPAVPPPPASAPPRAIVYPLVSVIAADGEVHPAERALVDRFLESEGLEPLAEHEFRVHHPTAVAHLVPKERREMVVQLMCETATADGIADESERRVIRAYAAAWEVPSEKVEFWMWGYENMSSSPLRTLWVKLRRFVLSARWSDAGQESR